MAKWICCLYKLLLFLFPKTLLFQYLGNLHTKSFAKWLPWRVVTELSKLKAKLAVAKGGETGPREKPTQSVTKNLQ